MATKGPLILITGASGFMGSHTVDNFLRNSYRVRLTGRNESTCQRLKATHASFASQVEKTVSPDIISLSAFDHAVHGVDGVVHVASPFTYKISDNERDLIIPAVKGAEWQSAEHASTGPRCEEGGVDIIVSGDQRFQ